MNYGECALVVPDFSDGLGAAAIIKSTRLCVGAEWRDWVKRSLVPDPTWDTDYAMEALWELLPWRRDGVWRAGVLERWGL